MSFIYPRVIRITRPGEQPEAVGWQGQSPSSQRPLETQVACDIPASIQAKSAGGSNPVGLPGDGKSNQWRVLTQLGELEDGQVKDRDIIYDDLGRRFQVIADYSNSLGANFIVERMEA